MFGRSIRRKPLSTHKAKRLRVERLESRQMLSGIVNVYTSGTDLYLAADSPTDVPSSYWSNKELTIQSVAGGGYHITGVAGTNFRYNTTSGSATQATVDLAPVKGDIYVELGGGSDDFTFQAPTAGGVSAVPNNLFIFNGPSYSINTLQNVSIGGNLSVTRVGSSGGESQLLVTGCTVNGSTTINNSNSTVGGDSVTTITGSSLHGSTGAAALAITNGDGYNQTTITGTSQIGTALTSPISTAVTITNGAEGSITMFGTAAAGPTIYGGVTITNGQAMNLQTNEVDFYDTQVAGAVSIDNTAGGDTMVNVKNSSTLGYDTSSGGLLTVGNGVGNNVFSMTGSALPWGLSINNDPTSTAPNQTTVDSSKIGTDLKGHTVTLANALIVDGLGKDSVVFRNGTVITGTLDMSHLGGGDKNVAIDSSTIGMKLVLVTYAGTGTDNVWIGGTTIGPTMNIALGSGTTDTLYLQKGATNSSPDSLPNLQEAGNGIFGSGSALGVDYLYYDTADSPLPPGISGFSYSTLSVTPPSWVTT